MEWMVLEVCAAGNGKTTVTHGLTNIIRLLQVRLFIIEGLGTVIVGIVAYFVLPGRLSV